MKLKYNIIDFIPIVGLIKFKSDSDKFMEQYNSHYKNIKTQDDFSKAQENIERLVNAHGIITSTVSRKVISEYEIIRKKIDRKLFALTLTNIGYAGCATVGTIGYYILK
ncbi:MAG: hypothetical protein ACP5NV_05235 [Candidatus Woesearchaeota archaeon]